MSSESVRLKSEEEFLVLRKNKMEDIRARAKKYVDEAEGSLVLVNLRYSEKSPSKPNGDTIFLGVAGGVHDIVRMLRALDRAKENLIQQTAQALDTEELLHFLAHLEAYNDKD